MRGRRQAFGDPQALGPHLVERQGRSEHATAGVGNAEELEGALQRAVLAAAAVQHDEAARVAFALELAELALRGIEGMGVHALGAQCLEHAIAAHQGNLALGGFSSHWDGHLAEAHATSPTMRTSVASTTPCIW